jgi:glycosyltransferase involved in cell wall biosynthesis
MTLLLAILFEFRIDQIPNPILFGGINLLDWLAALSLLCCGIPAVLFAFNVFLFQRAGQSWNRRPLPPVSVLIPARNEERSIAAAIKSVLASRGVDLELIVLDDGSTDRTAEIVQAVADEDTRVTLVTAEPLPKGWNGKQHACWLLAQKAKRDVLCFLDADVRLGPEALYEMLGDLNFQERKEPEKALVSGFPRQETKTILEMLLLPLIHFVLLGFLPFLGERFSGSAAFAAGCGQFMMVRRGPYFDTEGHSAIRTTMHDGLLLPKLLRKHGYRTAVYDLSHDATCRMYRGAVETWRGLSKNATEGMASPLRLPVFTVLLLAGQVLPLPLVVWGSVLWDLPGARMAFAALVFGYTIRFVSAARYRQSWLSAILHPIGILVLLLLQWSALLRKMLGIRAKWKERKYVVG